MIDRVRCATAGLLAFALAIAGCSSDDASSGSGAGGGGAAGSGAGGAGGTAGAAGTTSTGGSAGGGGSNASFGIVFDYRFDTKQLFDDPARRVALEAAAAHWSEKITEEFDDVPAGTTVLSRDPQSPADPGQTFPYDAVIDDLVVFVGFAAHDGPNGTLASSFPSAAIGSVSDPTLSAELQQRHTGPDFEPWTGWISFDESEAWFFDSSPETADDVPAGEMDFITVATHELGHLFGFGTADAFTALVVGDDFTGPAASGEHGGPVALTSTHKHFAAGVLSDGKQPLMDVGDSPGLRETASPLDLAVFSDLGLELGP